MTIREGFLDLLAYTIEEVTLVLRVIETVKD